MFKIKMAGLTIQIDNRYDFVRHQCQAYITDDENVDFSVSASWEELLEQRDENEVECTPAYCESLCIYRNICMQLPAHGAFLIHGASIAVDGQAYLFLAKSGVGKTTHIGFWMETFGDRAQVVNGDKPVLRLIGDQWYVCGTPWQGKEEWGTNTMVPLKAFCFLERGQNNEISLLPEQRVTERIFHQLLLPRDEIQMTEFFVLLEDLLKKIPCYLLSCNLQREAAVTAYEAMRQEKQ